MILSCSVINTNEWSGRLYYKVTSASEDLTEIVLDAVDVLLLDEGSPGYTIYKTDPRTTDYMMDNMELMTCKIAHLHSHNKMGVFFSGTDTSELLENSEVFDIYVSVIVNNKFDIIGKAYIAIEEEFPEVTVPTFVKALGKEVRVSSQIRQPASRRHMEADVIINYPDFGKDKLLAQITEASAIGAKRKAQNHLKPNKDFTRKHPALFEFDDDDSLSLMRQPAPKTAISNPMFLENLCVHILSGEEDTPPENIDIPEFCRVTNGEIDLAYLENNMEIILYEFIECNPALMKFPLYELYSACNNHLAERIPLKYEQLRLELETMFSELITDVLDEEAFTLNQQDPSVFSYPEQDDVFHVVD